MPDFPTTSGPGFPSTPSSGGGGSSGPEWIELTPAMMSGGVKSSGGGVSVVNTAWTQVGNNVSCEVVSAYADGMTEGYCWAVDAAVLLAALGVTESQMMMGEKSLLVYVRQKSAIGLWTNAGVALASSSDESGNASTLAGGGGGVHGHPSTPGESCAMAFDSAQEGVTNFYSAFDTYGTLVRIEASGDYWKATAANRKDADLIAEQPVYNFSGAFDSAKATRLVMWAGSGNTAITTNADMDVWFAAVDGVNFDATPPS